MEIHALPFKCSSRLHGDEMVVRQCIFHDVGTWLKFYLNKKILQRWVFPTVVQYVIIVQDSLLSWPHFDYVILSWLLDLEMGSRWTVSFHVLNLSYPNYITLVTYLMKCLSSIFVNSACGNRKILDAWKWKWKRSHWEKIKEGQAIPRWEPVSVKDIKIYLREPPHEYI